MTEKTLYVEWDRIQDAIETQVISFLNVVLGSPEIARAQIPEMQERRIDGHNGTNMLVVLMNHYDEISELAGWSDEPRFYVETILLWADYLSSGRSHLIPLLAIRELFSITATPHQTDEITVLVAKVEVDFMIHTHTL